MAELKKRCVYTDGLKNPFAFNEYEDGVYAIIGPFENFTAESGFQDELEMLCIKHNLANGHLSQTKHDELMRKYKKAAP